MCYLGASHYLKQCNGEPLSAHKKTGPQARQFGISLIYSTGSAATGAGNPT